MEQDTEQDLGPSLLESHVMMTGGFDPDLGQQVSIQDGSGADLSLEEGVFMTEAVENKEKRLPTSVRSSN